MNFCNLKKHLLETAHERTYSHLKKNKELYCNKMFLLRSFLHAETKPDYIFVYKFSHKDSFFSAFSWTHQNITHITEAAIYYGCSVFLVTEKDNRFNNFENMKTYSFWSCHYQIAFTYFLISYRFYSLMFKTRDYTRDFWKFKTSGRQVPWLWKSSLIV